MVEQLAVNQKVDGSIPSLPLVLQQFQERAYNSKVECTLDKREVGSSSLPRLRVCQTRERFHSNTNNRLNSSVVEHWTENPRVVGSIPTLSTTNNLLGEMVDALDLKSSSW